MIFQPGTDKRDVGQQAQGRPIEQPAEFVAPDAFERADGRFGPDRDLDLAAQRGDSAPVHGSVAGRDLVDALEAFGAEVGDAEGEDERSDEVSVLRLQAGEVAG